MQRSTIRTARKAYRCEVEAYGCYRWIYPGDLYRYHVASPDHGDLGNVGWLRARECASCAAVCGRPIPNANTATCG